MHNVISYIAVAVFGLLLAHFLTRAPELRGLRISQLIFVPAACVAAFAVLPEPSSAPGLGDIGAFVMFLGILGFIIVLLAPNIAHALGTAVTSFLDPQDWTPSEEEIALRPVIRLIDKGLYHDAFDELEALLQTRRPTYEALHLKAKLLNHFQRFDETIATLLQMIRLSHSAKQQLLVMELLAGLDAHQPAAPSNALPEVRQIRIDHELILFDSGVGDLSVHKLIPPRSYHVQEISRGRHRWLALQGEPWSNAAICWKAVEETAPAVTPVRKGLLYKVAQAHQSIVTAITGKSFRQAKADSHSLRKEADQFIRQNDWAHALPLLQKAAADDPDNYEIAYRLVQAAQQTCRRPEASDILNKVLKQSRWTEDEERMLKQLQP